MKPLGQDPCQSKLLCNSTPGVARGGSLEPLGQDHHGHTRFGHLPSQSSNSAYNTKSHNSNKFLHMEGTNAMFWRFELPWRGRMLMNLAELAAYVRDVKPESDVHSNLPNHWKNNGFNTADVFAACAEPTPDNQYTTFKPTLRLKRSRFNCVFAACAEPTPHHQYTTFKPTHIRQISFSHMRLPLMRNHLLTTKCWYGK